MTKKLKVLSIIEQCNPEWSSVPLEGYKFYEEISNLVDTTLVTHERNKPALEKRHPNAKIVYIFENSIIKRYYKLAERLSKIKDKTIWPLYNTLIYPIYAEFDRLVYKNFKDAIARGEYDIVHAITPMMPRYPVKATKACQNTPFVIGPVNGGVPFPTGFQKVARKEFSYFNFLRAVGRFIIPGYRTTYEQADRILAGSSYTLNLIDDLFEIEGDRLELFYENGVNNFSSELKIRDAIANTKNITDVNLLFVGRLVPYKGADMVIEAVSKLEPDILEKATLTIVGDGSERQVLEEQVERFNLKDRVRFTGWVAQEETSSYYKNSDIFCFPSVREFGGAVVLEAMANGLPCIVVDNGGIGEYVTEATGFKINPLSREFVVQELKKYIEQLAQNPDMRQNMSLKAIERAKEFTWDVKAQKIVEVYHQLLENSPSVAKANQ
jgi:glycosyltransferase involved in cell wall biosynthesis